MLLYFVYSMMFCRSSTVVADCVCKAGSVISASCIVLLINFVLQIVLCYADRDTDHAPSP